MNDDGHAPSMVTPPRIAQFPQAGPDEGLDARSTQRAFLAHMRHQLRTPINAMIGYSEMLMEDAADRGQEDFIPDLQRIHMASNQLLVHVNDIFDPARFEASPQAPRTTARAPSMTSGGKVVARLRSHRQLMRSS